MWYWHKDRCTHQHWWENTNRNPSVMPPEIHWLHCNQKVSDPEMRPCNVFPIRMETSGATFESSFFKKLALGVGIWCGSYDASLGCAQTISQHLHHSSCFEFGFSTINQASWQLYPWRKQMMAKTFGSLLPTWEPWLRSRLLASAWSNLPAVDI